MILSTKKKKSLISIEKEQFKRNWKGKFFGNFSDDRETFLLKLHVSGFQIQNYIGGFSSLNHVISNGCNNFTKKKKRIPRTPYSKISNSIMTGKLIFSIRVFFDQFM